MNERRRMDWRMWARSFAMLGLVCFAAFLVGYALTGALFRVAGSPPEWVRHVLSGLTGMLLMGLGSFTFNWLHRRMRGDRPDWNGHMRIVDEAMEAMNRIAHGDFSVLMAVDERGPFAELAESINRMARELGSMEKLRQDFISDVSHEIQSPLTSIGGFAALLRSGTLPPEQRAHYLDIIETEARRLSKLSDNLLKLSTLESGMQPLAIASFELHKQIENAVLLLEPQWANKRIDMELDLSRLLILGDEALLSQVWINLIVNAVKFTPEGGGIRIALSREGGEAVCRVEDTGPGIAPEDLIHVFERFYKADKARDRSLGGNGLGLSIVKKIVELHGGSVRAESEVGHGSAFTVRLPIAGIAATAGKGCV